MCVKNLEKISAYVDKELDHPEVATLEAHLAECEACRRILRATQEEKKLLRRSFEEIKAPAYLKRRIIESISKEARRPAKEKITFWKRFFAPSPTWAAISVALLIVAATIYLRTEGIIFPAGEKPTTIGLFIKDISHDAYLVYSLPYRPLDIESSSPPKVERFMSDHVGFRVQAPDLSGRGISLMGGRIWHTVARISALLVYENGEGRRFSLFEIARERIGKKGARTVVAEGRTFYVGSGYGYKSVAWIQGEVALGLVGDVPEEDLLDIAKQAAASLDRKGGSL